MALQPAWGAVSVYYAFPYSTMISIQLVYQKDRTVLFETTSGYFDPELLIPTAVTPFLPEGSSKVPLFGPRGASYYALARHFGIGVLCVFREMWLSSSEGTYSTACKCPWYSHVRSGI